MDVVFPGTGYKSIFYNNLSPMLIVGTDAPNYTMLDVNDAYLQSTHTKREDLIGKPVFGVFPANPSDPLSKNIERSMFSFEEAIQKKKPHIMSDYRYDIPIPGTNEFEERYWTTSNTPVLNADGEVLYFIHSPANVTELFKLKEREATAKEGIERQQQQLYATFMQAPVGIGIFKGAENIITLINPPLCKLYGKESEELIGKPLFDAIPSAKGIGYEELLDKVRLTGESFKADGMTAPIMRNDILETVHVNLVFEPYREEDGSISGVIVVATEVTEMIKAKIKVEEAEARASLAVSVVGLGTFDLDLKSGELVTSQKFANIFGFEEPADRDEYVKLFHPDDLTVRLKAHAKSMQTGHLEYEARIILQDGSTRWVKFEGKVFFNKDGEGIRLPGIALDITQQKKDREEQRKLVSLVENSVDLISIINLDGINSYLNEAGIKLLGFETAEQVATVPIKNLFAADDFKVFEEEVIPAVMKEGNWSGSMMVKHLKTGEVFSVYNNSFRIDDAVSGEPIAVGAVMRDMRPELLAKQALADSESLLRNITNATPTALWMADEQGNITYVNKTWLEWTGLTLEENLGMGWFSAVIETDRQRVADKFLADFNARLHYEVEFRINHADSEMHWCIANGQPQYNHEGIFKGYIGACIDITDQKLLQQQKDDFIAIASHELKTPVTSIKGYAQVLEKMLLKKGDVKEAMMMSRMDAQVKRLTNLIGDLLDVTKINSGKLQFNNTVFDFNPMVKELIEELQRTSEKHTLIEKFNEAGMVFGDRERISQVITNLITNAIKYSPTEDKIVIYTAIENGEVTLCVQDYGIGIPEDKLERVFEQFYRVSGDMQHTFPGLGLGLYISSEIIKREGGRIWVNSNEGQGSTFCFALPLWDDDKI